jgi:solute carrier family 25 glutamate transporter 18/22
MTDTKNKPELPLKIILASKVIDGGLAGITGVTATFPLDLSKTRLQKQVTPPGESPVYRNMLQTIQVVAQKEGLVGLYSGYKVNVSFIVFEKAVKLVANDMFRMYFTDKDIGKISLAGECLSGASAGALQSAVTTPMELLKIKGQLAAQEGRQFNTMQEMSKILKNEGPKGFYRGWCSTLVRDIPFSFIYFPLYANLKNTKPFGYGQDFKGNLAAGMIAGAVAGALSTPTDVIKTRLQDLPPGETMSWLKCVKLTYQNEGGLKPFFKGTGPRMVCIGSLFAVAQGFYELGIGKKVLT